MWMWCYNNVAVNNDERKLEHLVFIHVYLQLEIGKLSEQVISYGPGYLIWWT